MRRPHPRTELKGTRTHSDPPMPAVKSSGHRHRVYTSPGRIASLSHTGTLVPRPRVDHPFATHPCTRTRRGRGQDAQDTALEADREALEAAVGGYRSALQEEAVTAGGRDGAHARITRVDRALNMWFYNYFSNSGSFPPSRLFDFSPMRRWPCIPPKQGQLQPRRAKQLRCQSLPKAPHSAW